MNKQRRWQVPAIDNPPQADMFRTTTTTSPNARVDRKANVIFGANLMQVGDLNEGDSRDWTIDGETLAQAQRFMSQGNNGAKARYTHPNMSSDGMGSYLGRWKNIQVDGDTLRGDLHIADAAFKSPQGDLGTYVMDLAEEDPGAFGVSLATRLDRDALAAFEDAQYEERKLARKEGKELPEAKKWPMRFTGIRAGDVVDEPAATRGGFFSLTDVDNRNLPAQATALLNSYFADAEPDVVTARINGFLTTYFKSKGHTMPVAEPVEKPAEVVTTSTVDLAAETKKAADLAVQKERERITEIGSLCKQAGKPDLAAGFAEKGTSVEDVRKELFNVLCASNKPVGDEGGTGDVTESDPNAKFKAEFKQANYSMTEEQFVSLRRAEEGLEPFVPVK